MATAVVAVALALSTGCYKATFYSSPNAVRGIERDEWTSFFIFGLVGRERFDVREFCPSGNVAEVRTGGNFGTGIVGALTLGIYTPHKVYVTCAAGAAPAPRDAVSFEIDADRQGRPVNVTRRIGSAMSTGHVAAVEGSERAWSVRFEGGVL